MEVRTHVWNYQKINKKVRGPNDDDKGIATNECVR